MAIENEIYNPKWYVAYTLPRMEKKLESYLFKHKFEAYVPKLLVRSRWKDRWKNIEKPIFTSYIFIRMDYWKDRKKVIVLPGLHHFVYVGGELATVSEEDIEMVRLLVQTYPDRIQAEKNELLRPGQKVTIRYGVFAGKTAEILKVNKNLRSIIVRFPMIGQAIKVEVRTEDLGLEEEAVSRIL